MSKINIACFKNRIKKKDDVFFIFDIIRKKYVKLTPEEWVRQNTINQLIDQYKYPKSLIRVEYQIKYNSLPKRIDILIFNKLGHPLLIVECKALNININARSLNQICEYNLNFKSKILFITNGINNYFFRFNCGYYKQINKLPKYFDLI